jgi:hypothetical protein
MTISQISVEDGWIVILLPPDMRWQKEPLFPVDFRATFCWFLWFFALGLMVLAVSGTCDYRVVLVEGGEV